MENKYQPKFTVVLTYPNGEEVYIGQVHAMTPSDALSNARKQACIDNGYSLDPDDAEIDPTEFECVAIFRGHHNDCTGNLY